MVSTGDEIRQSDPSLLVLKLELDGDSDLVDLAAALLSLSTVKRVVVSAPETTEPNWSECRDFFVALGSLPGLESLTLKWLGDESDNNPVPLEYLTALLRAKIRTNNNNSNNNNNGNNGKKNKKKRNKNNKQSDNNQNANSNACCQLVSLRLTELTLSCQVEEGEEDFDDEVAVMQRFASALLDQRLREFRMDYCDQMTGDVDLLGIMEPGGPQWDPVFHALAQCPNLEKVIILEDVEEPEEDEDDDDDDEEEEVDCLSALGPLEDYTISTFVTLCTSLQELQLEAFHLSNQALIALGQALESPQARLKKLSLDLTGKRWEGCRSLAKMVAVNTSLEHLKLWVSDESGRAYNADEMESDDSDDSDDDSDKEGSGNEKDSKIDPDNAMTFLQLLAKSLETNRTLTSVDVQGAYNHLSAPEEAAFVHMLQSNGVIQNLKLLDDGDNHDTDDDFQERPEIALYLRLNQRGRRRLQDDFENITREEWIRVLSESASDLDSLFYWIHMNPHLCDVYRHYSGDLTSQSGQHTNNNRKKSGKKKRNQKGDTSSGNNRNNASELAMIAQLKATVAKLEKESEVKSHLIETMQQEMKTMAAEKEKVRLEYTERIAVLEKDLPKNGTAAKKIGTVETSNNQHGKRNVNKQNGKKNHSRK